MDSLPTINYGGFMFNPSRTSARVVDDPYKNMAASKMLEGKMVPDCIRQSGTSPLAQLNMLLNMLDR